MGGGGLQRRIGGERWDQIREFIQNDMFCTTYMTCIATAIDGKYKPTIEADSFRHLNLSSLGPNLTILAATVLP